MQLNRLLSLLLLCLTCILPHLSAEDTSTFFSAQDSEQTTSRPSSESTLNPVNHEPDHLPGQPLPSEPDSEGLYQAFTHMILSLGVILTVLIFLMWFVKRIFQAKLDRVNENSLFTILERRPITPKTTLFVVKIFEKGIVFAESHTGIARLAEITLPSEEEDSETMKNRD